jgi:hypothetical protein
MNEKSFMGTDRRRKGVEDVGEGRESTMSEFVTLTLN